MTDAPLTPEEERDALAAEYVLGVLELPERIEAERLIKQDASFAARVLAWENRLADLNEGYPEEAPSFELLARIEARLFPKQKASPSGWLFWAFGGLAASLIAVVVLVASLETVDPAKLVTLSTADQSLVYQANFRDDELVVTRAAGDAAPTGQVHELWIIAPGAAPVSLGLLAGKELVLRYPEPPANWVLAVSVEPAGGSPTGAPTGPVILTAEIGA